MHEIIDTMTSSENTAMKTSTVKKKVKSRSKERIKTKKGALSKREKQKLKTVLIDLEAEFVKSGPFEKALLHRTLEGSEHSKSHAVF